MPKTQTKSKTKSITNTKMAIATLALFVSGAAALATVPVIKPNKNVKLCQKYLSECNRGRRVSCNRHAKQCKNVTATPQAPTSTPQATTQTTTNVITGPRPDLVIKSVKLSEDLSFIELEIENKGSAPVMSSFSIALNVTVNTPTHSRSTFVTSTHLNNIIQRDKSLIRINTTGKLTQPSIYETGYSMHIVGWLDYNNEIPERDESNNGIYHTQIVSARQPGASTSTNNISIIPTGRPDLALNRIYLKSDPASSTTTLVAIIKNIGNVPVTSDFSVSYLTTSINTPLTTDIPPTYERLKQSTILRGGIPAGEAREVVLISNLPKIGRPPMKVLVWIDEANVIIETDETNNRSSAVTIVGAPDLKLSSVRRVTIGSNTLSPSTDLVADIENIGDTLVTSEFRISFATTTSSSALTILNDSSRITSIRPTHHVTVSGGVQVNGMRTVRLLPNFQRTEGPFYIVIWIDSSNMILELDEKNNITSGEL